MLKRLRNLLRQWLLDDIEYSSKLEVWYEGRLMRVEALRAAGLDLVCKSGQRTFLVGVSQARDEKHFWALWRQMQEGEYSWEDGMKYVP